jgi:hypothetical protein
MYSKDGETYFIVDAHVALWDARPENQRNIHGKQFIDCFYDYHRNLSPSPRCGRTRTTSTRAASG